jgi:RNA 2',3'-cyclic 3'-phosphodiesterase
MTPAGTVEGDERLRLFLGFRLPDSGTREIAAWQRAELDVGRARIVPVENLHVTIAFLGSRPASETEPVGDALREAVSGVAEPVLTPVRYRETRSVGMLVLDDEDARATQIAREAQRRLAELGVYEPEQRPWLPHLTVVRFRERPRLQPSIPGVGPMRTSDAAVYMSRLRPTGAQYEVVESVPLGGG